MPDPVVYEVSGSGLYDDPLFDNSTPETPVAEIPVVEVEETEVQAEPETETDEHSELEAELLGLEGEDEETETEGEDKTAELDERLTAVKSDMTQVFDSVFQEKFGVSVEEAKAILAGADQVVIKGSVEAQEAELKKEWGDSYDVNIAAVADQWNKLSPKLKAKYDNLDGIRLIHSKLPKTQTKATTSTKPSRETASLLGRGTTKQTAESRAIAPTYKQSELLTMPKEQYEKQLSQITKAFQEGRVLNDV